MKDFKELKVWEKAHSLALKIYQASKVFPPEERYGLTSQIRRAAVSVATNIAEGCGRSSDMEFARFLEISFASASELMYLVLLSRDLDFFDMPTYQQMASDVEETKRMLYSFIQKVKERSK